MPIVYHGSGSLFDRYDPSKLTSGQGDHKFGAGAYLTDRYTTAAVYAGKANKPKTYVYTVEIPAVTEDNHLISAGPIHPDIVRRTSEKLGVSIPEKALSCGKFFRKWIGNTITGEGNTINQKINSASLEAEKAASKFLLGIGVILLVWPTAQTKPDGDKNYALLDYSAFRILRIDEVKLDAKGKLIEGSQKLIKEF